jgi:hypothetical protein
MPSIPNTEGLDTCPILGDNQQSLVVAVPLIGTVRKYEVTMSSSQAISVTKMRGRSTSHLDRRLEKNLLAYAIAAGATLLPSALPADAQIIYTPSNTPLAIAQQNHGPALTPLDLNNDGTPDFTFLMLSTLGFHSTTFSATTTRFKFLLKIDPARKGNQVVEGKQSLTASAVPAGVTIGPKEKFAEGDAYLRFQSFHPGGSRNSGTWQNVEYAYVGLKFLINGEVHYGWARVKFPYPGSVKDASIYGYAYESTPNQSIVTGQTSGNSQGAGKASLPATLGTLATGAVGIDLWRTHDSPNSAQ